uniref:Uncharacterized protein n=1 Tax=Glossina brevipalpis TaxID=37001 RepID=A0A1A9VZ40_9MUSC
MQDKCNPSKFTMRDKYSMKSVKNYFVAAIIVALSATASLYLFRSLPHRDAYKDFYANYDPRPSFKRVLDSVYIQSFSSDKESGEKKK